MKIFDCSKIIKKTNSYLSEDYNLLNRIFLFGFPLFLSFWIIFFLDMTEQTISTMLTVNSIMIGFIVALFVLLKDPSGNLLNRRILVYSLYALLIGGISLFLIIIKGLVSLPTIIYDGINIGFFITNIFNLVTIILFLHFIFFILFILKELSSLIDF